MLERSLSARIPRDVLLPLARRMFGKSWDLVH